ncbi:hypothetical protein LG34_12825 [Eubacterium ramulus]|uniref:Anti-sigma-W factor RsiW n=1 Tax=Eubacterium ramulus TaxID=39490 RepID=A0A2V1JRG8_EUBRA|nr:DUF4825 domain-containing protein [Eubacterium ramulus]PWE85953.1 hypothetical protein LG34_12825 [Eubacterium ramulus]
MKNDLTCEVVQDLLPSYVDGLTSDVSNQAVEQHMKTCESCRKLYSEMREPMNGEDVSEINDGQKADSKKSSEIDYLKKIRKKNRMRILAAVLIVVIAVGVGLWSKVYVVGQEVEQAEFVQANVAVEDHKVSVQGLLLDTTKGVSDVAFQEKDGIVTVSLRETRKSSFHTNEFQADYQSAEDVKQVVLENRILWDDGVSIDGTVSDLYQSRNPYVGDTSADGRSVQAARAVLGINDGALISYGTQLQTSEEPYGWTFLNVQISSSDNVERLHQEMKQLGCLLIAVTDNLGYVSFEYSVDGAENADGNTTLTVTEADVDAMAGQSVKAMAQTPEGLQQLVDLIK